MMQKQSGDLFLSSSALDRLNLFTTIRQLRLAQMPVAERLAAQKAGVPFVTEVNLRQVANATGRNYGSIYNIYNDLLGVLGHIAGDAHADLATLFNISDARLRYEMITQTSPFQYMQAALSGADMRFDDFVAPMHLSRMTVMRHLHPLRDLAQVFGIKMLPEHVSFAGEETHLRLLLTTLFWQATNGVIWPFTHIAHSTAKQVVDRIYQTLDCQTPNAASKEISMYYLAVALQRMKAGHILTYDRSKVVLDYPLPSLDLALGHGHIKDFDLPPMTRLQVMGEANFGFFLMHLQPNFVVSNDTQMQVFIERFRRYAPEVYQLTRGFVSAFPAWDRPLSPAEKQLMQANLLAVSASVLTLGVDINQLVAYTFHHELAQRQKDPNYERIIRQTLTQVILSQHLESFIDIIDALCDNFYQNLRQFKASFRPQQRVKVLLSLDQSGLADIDLVAMLKQQAIVTLLPPTADPESADLVIQAAALATQPGANLFNWPEHPTPECYGDLYAVLMSLWQQKQAASTPKRKRA
ncbi:helix-turn-helix domain-containing protein [Lacticaseibacillus sp. N501-2]|uniref:helix-turn-helix domain-containing protein n=1 Tax=Lacticaseibacillus salsurae TaxID=3367729 RepID=UPI0038B2DE79